MHAKDLQRKAGEPANGIRRLGRCLGDSPAGALLAALAVGFAVGLLLRLLEKPPKENRRGS
jgi:hypothetical protein